MSVQETVGYSLPQELSRVKRTLEQHKRELKIVSLLLGLVAWQVYSTTQPAYLFPGIPAIFDAFVLQINDYELISRFRSTLMTVFIGYSIAVVVGISVGVLTGLNEYVEAMLDPYINALYVSPISALVPVIILILGATLEGRAFVVFLFAVFEITINTQEGIKTTPESLIEVGRSFGASRLQLIWNIDVPHASPYIFAGLRLGLGRGIRGVILAELLVDFINLGAIIRLFEEQFNMAGIFSITILLMITGFAATSSLQMLGNWYFDWQEGETV